MEINSENQKVKQKFDLKDFIKTLLDKFKYKGFVLRKNENEYHDYLRKMSFDSSGVIDYKDGCIVTRDNRQYKIFKLEFKNANGLDKHVDQDNYDGLVQIQDVLSDDYYITFPQEHKYNLQNNIEFYQNCLKREKNKSRQKIIEENIRIMSVFNQVKYVSVIMGISMNDVDKFKKIADSICNVIEYNKEETEIYLDQINNEVQ